jgi:hypothetical protein
MTMIRTTVISALLLLLCASPASLAAAEDATVTYHFENPQLQPAIYTVTMHQDGSGQFHSEPGSAPAADTDGVAPRAMDREIHLGEGLRRQIFAYAHTHKHFGISCDSGNMHLAFTGKHTFSYAGPDGQGACTFNYSKDAVLERFSGQMMAFAFTLEEGRRLVVEHTHSRLSLDAELETLQEAVKDNRAIGLENISTELQAIVDDPNVMLRARNRAQSLLKSDTASAQR